MKPCPQIEKDSLTPATASNTGVSAGRLRETSQQPDACDMPVGIRRPIRQNSDSSKVFAQKQDQCKRSKCKTSQMCEFCPEEFKNVSQVRQHKRDHTGDRPFKCDVCEKSFTLPRNLCAHKRTHTGRKQHKCKTCGTSFLRSTALRRHERIHSGERPFTCKTFGKSFAPSSHLRDHERIHRGERPYRCRECPEFFRRSSCLRRHERIHNLEMKRLKFIRRVFSMCENAFFLFALMNSKNKIGSVCVCARVCVFVCVCVYLCVCVC